MRVELPASPDVQLLGGEVVALKGLAALDAYRLISEGISVRGVQSCHRFGHSGFGGGHGFLSVSPRPFCP
jgi:hypothetical protein